MSQWIAAALLCVSPLAAQDVGETLAARGERGVENRGGAKLEYGSSVYRNDVLFTGAPVSRLLLLLIDGQEVVLSDRARVQLFQGLPELRSGTVRVGAPETSPGLVLKTPVGSAKALSTSFLAGCGAPVTANLESCLFLGVYGRTEVVSDAAPDRPVTLEPQFFTVVRRGEPPDPPRRMSDARFQELIDLTTIVGTGSPRDRLDIVAAPAWIPPPDAGPGPITDVPVDPAPPPELPEPPRPPGPSETG